MSTIALCAGQQLIQIRRLAAWQKVVLSMETFNPDKAENDEPKYREPGIGYLETMW